MPRERASMVSSSGKKIENAATSAKITSMIRRIARCRAFEPPRMSARETTTTASTRTIWTMICNFSPKQKVSDDVDGIQQGLAFCLGVVGVDDLNGVLHPARADLGDLMDQFRGVRHPVLGQVDLAGNVRPDGAQPVVRVG